MHVSTEEEYNIMQKPLYLDTDESLDGDLDVGGRGNDLWKICESAHTGDVKTVQELIDRDPNLVTYEYIIPFLKNGSAKPANGVN